MIFIKRLDVFLVEGVFEVLQFLAVVRSCSQLLAVARSQDQYTCNWQENLSCNLKRIMFI